LVVPLHSGTSKDIDADAITLISNLSALAQAVWFPLVLDLVIRLRSGCVVSAGAGAIWLSGCGCTGCVVPVGAGVSPEFGS